MKIANKILILILSLILTFTTGPALVTAASSNYTVKDVTLQLGSDESMMNFCWCSNTGNTSCYVQIAKSSEMTGDVFPSSAVSFSGTVGAASKGYNSNKVNVTGFLPLTEYVYRVGNGVDYSEVYSLKTEDSGSYNAIFISDAQIGASGSTSNDKASWEKTLSTALGNFSNASFILSAGDQVDYYLESEYDAFLASPLFRSVPLAPTVGNHENISSSAINSYHYDEPNESSVYGTTPAGGDYWFKYGYTLYIVLNTNNTDVTEHDAFIGKAIAANPDVTWSVLMFHQSIYSSAEHSTDSSIVALRNSMYPVIDKYHIDLVLSGHDHRYTRTYQMLDGVPQTDQTVDKQGRVVNPTGTLYITAGTASGSKYYDLKSTPEAYAAMRLQLEIPTFSDIKVTGNTLTVTTYRVDTMGAIDTYTIEKQTSSDFVDVPDSAWYSPAVKYIGENNITNGTGNYRFSPNATLTRGQFIVLLMKAYGIAPDTDAAGNFSDAGNTYYTNYLAAAKRLGITQGTGNNKYLPDSSISRQDMFTILYNALNTIGKLPTGAVNKSYSDAGQIAGYAETAIKTLTAGGVISGSDGMINPAGLSTRAQIAQVLYNLLTK